MSRIVVKNLPKTVTEQKLRTLFSGRGGTITDVQLKFTPEGKFRRFAFIGFQSENEAEDAISYFHNTRVETSKISVERCEVLGGRLKNVKTDKKEEVKEVKDDNELDLEKLCEEDPLFEEYLKVHNVDLSKTKLKNKKSDDAPSKPTADSEATPALDKSDEDKTDDETSTKLADAPITDSEYLKLLMEKSEKKPRQRMEKQPKVKIDLFVVKLKNLPYSAKKKDVKTFLKPLKAYSIRMPRTVKGIAYVGFKTEKLFRKALLKDKSILGGKQINVCEYTNKDNSDQASDVKGNPQRKQISMENVEEIGESGRIFIRNLSYTTKEEDLRELFEKFGDVVELNLPLDSTTRVPKGFGVCTFLMPEQAVRAYSELDGTIFHGRMLHLLPAKTIDEQNEDDTDFKKNKEKKLKKTAGSAHNWNSLFLGENAVADAIAANYGKDKSEVLTPHGEGAAVRLALGEARIVAETKEYLLKEGVDLDAFNGNRSRSRNVILVKNLPAGTDRDEIARMFSQHGLLGRVVMPPSGVTALVEFLEPQEARRAFTRLAYTKYKNQPLYLEWAPEGGLSDRPGSDEKTPVLEESAVESTEDIEPEPDTTLFVKNLNFKTDDSSLKRHFESCGRLAYANVALKKTQSSNDDNNNGKMSMGYGFVRYLFKSDADKALKTLQGSLLDGKSLELKRSERVLRNELNSETVRKVQKKTPQTGTKILVRNVPFQAHRDELQSLFKTFGEIKTVRLPKKMSDGSSNQHRGFAFVDFVSAAEAKRAFEALCQSTHLYGRRLVLEWAATDDEEVAGIRKRTADHFFADSGEKKRSKKAVLNVE